MEDNNTSKTGTVDGGLTVFTAGRDLCLVEKVRWCYQQYAEHRCTLDEFVDMYEAVMLQAAQNQLLNQQ